MRIRSITPTAAVFVLAIALVACGKKDGAGDASTGGGMAVADDTGGLKKPRKDCGRARRLLAETPPGPVQDVLGIRTGTSEADAFALLSCRRPKSSRLAALNERFCGVRRLLAIFSA